MSKLGRGLICLPLTKKRLEELHLPLMVQDNTARFQTAFTISIDAKEGITTGISAYDRARTVQARRRSEDQAFGPRPARAYFPAPGQRGRGSRPGGPDRSRGRPGPPRRPDSRRRDLRDHERRRDHGPDARARKDQPGARHPDPDYRRPDQLPDEERMPRSKDRRSGASDPIRRFQDRGVRRHHPPRKLMSPWSKARSAPTSRRLSGRIPNASPATRSAPAAATAASSSTGPWK